MLKDNVIVLVVDDHKLVCDGLAALVKNVPFVKKVYATYAAPEALSVVKLHRINVALIDARMPHISGLELMAQLRKEYPTLKIIGMTSYDEDNTLLELISTNVEGILLKRSTTGSEIEQALKKVIQNESYFSDEVAARIRSLSLINKTLIKLSQREKEVLALICHGNSTKEIAAQLMLSASTIEDYRKSLLEKTKVKNMPELVALAHRNGLVD